LSVVAVSTPSGDGYFPNSIFVTFFIFIKFILLCSIQISLDRLLLLFFLMQNTTQLFKIFNYSIISKTCLNLLCLVCDQVILCMNGKLLHRKITTLVCCVYAASLPILWENIVQWTFIRSNGTQFRVLVEVLSLMNFIEPCFFLYRLYHNLAFTPMYVYVLIVSTRGKLLTHKLHSMFLWFSFGYKTRYFLCILRQKHIN
jgi:hypothetical protein